MENTNENLDKTSAVAPTNKLTKNTKSRIPKKDTDLQTVCINVNTKWLSNTNITLPWTTQTDFTNAILDYRNELNLRYQAGGSRPGITQELKQLDAEIDDKIGYVKGYILEKFGKQNATSNYSQFGIVKLKKSYQMPDDRDVRLKSLTMMVDGIKSTGFANKTYGIKYWTDILNKYQTLKTAASTTDSTISNKVGAKNEIKIKLQKTLSSLVHLIKAHYPDTWKTELRTWGFQKEKY